MLKILVQKLSEIVIIRIQIKFNKHLITLNKQFYVMKKICNIFVRVQLSIKINQFSFYKIEN